MEKKKATIDVAQKKGFASLIGGTMKKRGIMTWLCAVCILFFLTAAACQNPPSTDSDMSGQADGEKTGILEGDQKDNPGGAEGAPGNLPEETTEPQGAPEPESTAVLVSIPEGLESFDGALVTVNGEKLPLYQVMVNTSQTWNGDTKTREPAGVGYMELAKGTAAVTVTLPYEIDYSSRVRPLSEGIIPVADLENRTLSFEITRPGAYTIEPNDDRRKAIHLFVTALAQEVPQDGKVLYFEAGLHTAENNPLISKNNVVTLTSGTTVYLETGAVVRAKFLANNASDITIMGHGIIDGSAFVRNSYTGEVTVPLEFNHCSNITLKDISVLDPAGWCVNFYFVRESKIDGMKIITSRSNGDGISIQSCQDITVSGCFVRSWDDSLVVKNYPDWGNRSIQGETAGIVFENCILWTDLAQSMEIGYETVGSKMEDITFRDITVLHALHRAPISIHNANNADIRNVRYENIVIEDASMTQGDTKGGSPVMEITAAYSPTWSDQHTVTGLGSVEGVTINGLKVLSGSKNISIGISGSVDTREGYLDEHWIRDISFWNVEIKGTLWNEETANLQCNRYTEHITITEGKER